MSTQPPAYRPPSVVPPPSVLSSPSRSAEVGDLPVRVTDPAPPLPGNPVGGPGAPPTFSRRLRGLGVGLGLGALVGVPCGLSSALFLVLLDAATGYRLTHQGIVFLLPVAGLVIGWLYQRYGRPISAGSNLAIDAYHEGGPTIPGRMAPMVLAGTVLTHLFGGSAGREGTAVQMGSSLADNLARLLRLSPARRRQALAAGVAGGFGAVFGTPVAGTLFAMEIMALGRLQVGALVPALGAAVVGDVVVQALGEDHKPLPQVHKAALTPVLFLKWVVFSAAMALATVIFIELLRVLKGLGERYVTRLPLRMALGGGVVVALWHIWGTNQFLGLGVPTIVRSFEDPHLPWFTFAGKLLFTAVTLGAGFLGGEVTPLFFVGASLGSVLGRLMDIPLELAAGVGMAAVFAAASNAPLALSLMAVEILGFGVLPHVLVVCVLAYALTGHRSIYSAQLRWGRGKVLNDGTNG